MCPILLHVYNVSNCELIKKKEACCALIATDQEDETVKQICTDLTDLTYKPLFFGFFWGGCCIS